MMMLFETRRGITKRWQENRDASLGQPVSAPLDLFGLLDRAPSTFSPLWCYMPSSVTKSERKFRSTFR